MAAGSIVVDLLMRTGSFETDANRAARSVAKMQQSIASSARAIGISFAGIATGLLAMTKNAIDMADEMNKAAQKIGVPVEQLSKLKYAAELADVSFDALQQSLKKFNVNISEAGQGSKEQAETFKRLGIAVKDASGNLRSTESIMQDVAGRFAGMADGAQKTELAVKLFGKAGADMIPLLNAGANGLREAAGEAQRLGIVLDTQTAAAAEKFNDDLTRLQKSANGLSIEFAKNALPALNEITNAMVQAAKEAGILTALWVGLGGAAAAALGKTQPQMDSKRLAEINKQLAIAQKQLSSGTLKPAGSSDSFFGFLVPDIVLNAEAKAKLKASIDALTKERDAIIASQRPAPAGTAAAAFKPIEIPGVSRKAGGRSRVSSAASDELKLLQRINELTADSFDDEMERIAAAVNDDDVIKGFEALRNEAAQLYEQTRTPLEQFSAQMQRIKTLADTGLIDPETAGRAMQQFYDDFAATTKTTTDEVTEFWKQAAANMENAMGNLFFDAMEGRLGDFANSFKSTINRMVADLLASQLLNYLKKQAISGAFGDTIGSIVSGAVSPSAKGNAFGYGGMMAFASGGIVSAPTPFTFGGGRLGVMGEAGPEAILPLSRGANGKLGVQVTGGRAVNVYNSFAITGAVDHRTQQQIGAEVGSAVNRSIARNK